MVGEAIFRFSAEEALSESEERYRMLVDTMNEGLGMDDENGLLAYANDRLCEMLGYSRDEIIGRPVLSFFDGKNQKIIKEQIEKRNRGENEPYRIEWMGKDGQKIITLVSPKGIFDENGDYRGSFAVITDITEKLRLESIAEAVNTMENIGFIFSGIRHEIGNPVYSIKMALSVLKQNIDSYSIDKIKEYADRMLEEISRMEYLLKTMKNFNMYETVELVDTDMTDFMKRFLSLVKADFEKKGIKDEIKVFAADRLNDARVRLYERYAELLPEGSERTRAAAAAQSLDSLRRSETDPDLLAPALAPDFEGVDHRHLGLHSLRGAAAYVEHLRSWRQVADDIVFRERDILALEPHGMLINTMHPGTARAGGGAYERPFLTILLIDSAGRLARAEWFKADREAEALARFDALVPRRVRTQCSTSGWRKSSTPTVSPSSNGRIEWERCFHRVASKSFVYTELQSKNALLS